MKKTMRQVAQVTVTCQEHGGHVVTLESDDDTAGLMARYFQSHWPHGDHIEVEVHDVVIYEPDEMELPF